MKSEKYIIKVLFTAILIIIFASFEAFIKAKSQTLFLIFQNRTGLNMGEYINLIMYNYLLDILEPVIISIFLFFIMKKMKMNRLIKFVLCGMVIAKLILKIFKLEFNSIFYYLGILLYIMLFYFILKVPIYSEGKNNV
ncbi:MAG: hypothetical protein Q4E02_04600 [Lagierella massiliensis]|nr:hypothetical protein [Lagierella massiliensis]